MRNFSSSNLSAPVVTRTRHPCAQQYSLTRRNSNLTHVNLVFRIFPIIVRTQCGYNLHSADFMILYANSSLLLCWRGLMFQLSTGLQDVLYLFLTRPDGDKRKCFIFMSFIAIEMGFARIGVYRSKSADFRLGLHPLSHACSAKLSPASCTKLDRWEFWCACAQCVCLTVCKVSDVCPHVSSECPSASCFERFWIACFHLFKLLCLSKSHRTSGVDLAWCNIVHCLSCVFTF